MAYMEPRLIQACQNSGSMSTERSNDTIAPSISRFFTWALPML